MEFRPILRLNDEIIGKIAAGEVVENPASAIKELVENSLDAGATCVTVEIRDGGISYLRVTDNGRGIPARDVRMAFERHATSKITKADDLFNLHTLGFRGEALASIAAVSKLTLTTRTASEETGTRAVNEGGVIRSISEAASPQGTTIVARDLFFNTPVRLKFLKKPVSEASRVTDLIARLILAHPDISFRLVHNGKQIYSSSGNGDLRSAVFCLYGRETANSMIPVHSEGAIEVTGLVGVGLQARSNRSRQTFIVNGRTIKSALLTQALEEGCRERVTVGHYPICALDIRLPVQMVDVNVHPNKLEVRFSDENLIYQHVKGAVADCFSVSPLANVPRMSLTADEEKPSFLPGTIRVIHTDTAEGIEQAKKEAQAEPAEKPSVSVHVIPTRRLEREEAVPAAETENAQAIPKPVEQEPFSSVVTRYFSGASLRESTIPGRPVNLPFGHLDSAARKEREERPSTPVPAAALPAEPPAQIEQEPQQQSLLPEEKASSVETELADYQMIGVAFDTYIILQNKKQMIFIDQHAAHERILYEKLMREIDRGTGSQVLLSALVVHVTPQEAEKIETYKEEICAAGYDVEPFGDDSYRIRAVPNVLGEPQGRGAFLDMVDRLGELKVLTTQQKRRDAILQMACKKAIKGGDRLSMEEIKPLLSDMLKTGAPPTCPHGRPLIVALGKAELEKRFRRIND